MPRRLKVYGWTGHNQSPYSRQSRNIIAAHSVAEVLRLTGTKRSEYAWTGCVTGNSEEIQQAMSKTGTMFWQPLDNSEVWYEQSPVS